jgi:hypoxanthine-guanine phosphoribosyltransferase
VVGFGLDYAENYRNLSDVCVLEETAAAPAGPEVR